MIAEKTRSGPNDLPTRLSNATEIERLAANPVLEAAILAPLIIKRRRGEKCEVDWIPDGTKLARLKSL
jgi:hypothetical protein